MFVPQVRVMELGEAAQLTAGSSLFDERDTGKPKGWIALDNEAAMPEELVREMELADFIKQYPIIAMNKKVTVGDGEKIDIKQFYEYLKGYEGITGARIEEPKGGLLRKDCQIIIIYANTNALPGVVRFDGKKKEAFLANEVHSAILKSLIHENYTVVSPQERMSLAGKIEDGAFVPETVPRGKCDKCYKHVFLSCDIGTEEAQRNTRKYLERVANKYGLASDEVLEALKHRFTKHSDEKVKLLLKRFDVYFDTLNTRKYVFRKKN
jgi:hypothetical protein